MPGASIPDQAGLRPRKPQQQRARDRVERVLEASEALLTERGIAGFSIPLISERLGFPRASVYKFFPTPYAALNLLAQRHLQALERELLARARTLPATTGPRAATHAMVEAAAGYYRTHPVACMLLLGGPLTDASYQAMEYAITRLGRLCRKMLARVGVSLPEGRPDVAALAVEFGTASLRYAYFADGEIGDAYVDAAVDVMVAFLELRMTSAKPAEAAAAG